MTPKKIEAFAETLDTGGMGIGIYPRGQFVHIDVRPLPSYRWVDYSPPNPNASEKRPPARLEAQEAAELGSRPASSGFALSVAARAGW